MTDVSGARPSGSQPYLSCRHIERGLVFYPGALHACCNNPATGKTPAFADFGSGLDAIDKVRAGRDRIRARHKAGDVVEECQGCPRLQSVDWEADNALMRQGTIDEVTIAHFTTCNIRCNYCYTVNREAEWTAPVSKVPRLLPTFRQLIETGELARHAIIRFSGGEPTLLPEFEDLLALLSEYGAHSIVYTNGVKRSQAIIDALKLGKIEVIMGVDAATPVVYKAIKKMDYNEAVWKNVAEYCASAAPNAVSKVWTKFIFCGENYHEAAHFVRRAEAAGAKHLYDSLDTSRNHGRSRQDLGPLPEEIIDYIALFRHECMKRGIEVEFGQNGVPWLTPERSQRIERKLEQLNCAHAGMVEYSF